MTGIMASLNAQFPCMISCEISVACVALFAYKILFADCAPLKTLNWMKYFCIWHLIIHLIAMYDDHWDWHCRQILGWSRIPHWNICTSIILFSHSHSVYVIVLCAWHVCRKIISIISFFHHIAEQILLQLKFLICIVFHVCLSDLWW